MTNTSSVIRLTPQVFWGEKWFFFSKHKLLYLIMQHLLDVDRTDRKTKWIDISILNPIVKIMYILLNCIKYALYLNKHICLHWQSKPLFRQLLPKCLIYQSEQTTSPFYLYMLCWVFNFCSIWNWSGSDFSPM